MAPATEKMLLEYLDRRFDGLDREIRDIKIDLREVKVETKKTNGNVIDHGERLAGIEPRLDGVIDDVAQLQATAHSPEKLEQMLQSAVSSITAGLSEIKGGKVTIEAQTGEGRRLTRWDAMIFASGGGAVWALIKFIEWALHSLRPSA